MTDGNFGKISFNEYQSELGERAAGIVLEKLCRLTLEKINEDNKHPTPDYRIIDENGEVVAVCEVKTCIEEQQAGSGDGKSFEELQEQALIIERNYRSILANKHRKAISQLGQEKNLRVIVFVSLNMTDVWDMEIFLQDYKNIFPNKATADLYIFMKIRQPFSPSVNFEVREMIAFRYDSEAGKKFAQKYLSINAVLKTVGVLPLKFTIQ